MINFWTFQTFSEVLPTLIHFWKLTKRKSQKDCLHKNGLTVHIDWTTKNFLLTKPFRTNFEFATLSKNSILTTRSWSVVVWRQSHRWSKWESLKHHPLEQRIISTRRKWGSKKKCSQLKTFCAATKPKTLSQHWKLCRKRSGFITTQALICWSLHVLHLTWPLFVCTVSTSAKFYPFTESDKGLLSKIREDIVGGLSIVFTRAAVVELDHIRKSKNVC